MSTDFFLRGSNGISSFSSIIDDQRHTILADCDDDGETGASSRMLHLMDVSHSFSSYES